ncbi:dihydrofolate reductase [Microterricola gilva]|uniref:Dihydrofolate reductase n=1 Tax=Microterricola gilva TaxID=393267 RepID=A0A4Q8AJT2_9MICO|nr:dihydrofolate reductase family protein [Microterricola gilva]RZU64059.1 dihydrofolate reductase [Microterricola gilva]
MAKLIYDGICSLDGFTADAHGNFDFAMPDAEVHRFVNDYSRSIRTYLFGRRMYEVMTFWNSVDEETELPDYIKEYTSVWRAADKIVYTRTLTEPAGPRTRFERRFDVATIKDMKAASDHDIGIGGPTLASHALRAGLVDEVRMLISPIILGAGLHMFPADVRHTLKLIDERRFAGGVVYLSYAVTG